MKTGLIVEGGGMKNIYSAGVLDAFLDAGIHFDVVAGVSAGSANAASFLAGQRERNKRFYLQHSLDPRYFGMKSFLTTGSAFGLDYIYGDLSSETGADPLDYDALRANPSEFIIPATNARTGRPHYFTKADLGRNHYEAISASCALPVICRPVKFGSTEYFDGGVSDSIPIYKLRKMGCDRIVIIFSKPNDFHMKPQSHRAIYTAALQKYPNIIYRLNRRHKMYNKEVDYIIKLRNHDIAQTFAPSDKYHMSTTTMDTEVMAAMYEEGLANGRDRADETKTFLGLCE